MKKLLLVLLLLILFYTRFVNLNWGLPYPFHPDERNLATALQTLHCDNFKFQISNFKFTDCFNPHFFAYGQFSMYLGYVGIQIGHFFLGALGKAITFEEAVMSLRTISALASVLNLFVLLKIIGIFINPKKIQNSNSEPFVIRNSPAVLRHFRRGRSFVIDFVSILLLIFAPYFIQFSHFGTTESLLMLFYSLIVYICLTFESNSSFAVPLTKFSMKSGRSGVIRNSKLILLSLVSGLAVATKLSALIFLVLPFLLFLKNIIFDLKPIIGISLSFSTKFKIRRNEIWEQFKKSKYSIFFMVCFIVLTAFFAILFSPHNLISYDDFIYSMKYESMIATGAQKVFYTIQFENTIPVIFHFVHIFPYVLGWPMLILSLCGFVFLPYTKKMNVLRVAILIYFIPNTFFYTKWSRFMIPILPLMSVMGFLMIYKLKDTLLSRKDLSFFNFQVPMKYQIPIFKIDHWNLNENWSLKIVNLIIIIVTTVSILPGLAYLSIYNSPDVRFTASNWIYKNIPANVHILSESANVVDIPIPNKELPARNALHSEAGGSNNETMEQWNKGTIKQYTNYNSFFLYDVDNDPNLQEDLNFAIQKSDYIFIPSRRVFMNLHCGDTMHCKYPILNRYYTKLFSGDLGFTLVKTFTSYPRIELFGKTLIEFPDENAEETWSVFDHPVIRIYKRN